MESANMRLASSAWGCRQEPAASLAGFDRRRGRTGQAPTALDTLSLILVDQIIGQAFARWHFRLSLGHRPRPDRSIRPNILHDIRPPMGLRNEI